jgi:hypothetical protein
VYKNGAHGGQGDYMLTGAQLIPWTHIEIGAAILLLACVVAPVISIAVSLRKVSVQNIVQE